MLEKTSPFVISYDEHCARPVWPRGKCLECLGQEGIPALHIAVGMIIIRRIEVEESELRINEGDRGQRPVRRVGEELLVGSGNPKVLQSPKCQNRDVRESSRFR